MSDEELERLLSEKLAEAYAHGFRDAIVDAAQIADRHALRWQALAVDELNKANVRQALGAKLGGMGRGMFSVTQLVEAVEAVAEPPPAAATCATCTCSFCGHPKADHTSRLDACCTQGCVCLEYEPPIGTGREGGR